MFASQLTTSSLNPLFCVDLFSLREGDANVRQEQQHEGPGRDVSSHVGKAGLQGLRLKKEMLGSFLDEKTENLPPPRPWTTSFPSLTPWHGAAPPILHGRCSIPV